MIKTILKNIVVFFLRIEAKLILKKYKPKIVAVTGSVGKTSLKDAIALVLGSKFNVRKSEKSYNSQLGVPLTIIGAKSAWNNVFGWLEILIKGLALIFKTQHYPQWLVLEMGVSRPGDMDFLVSLAKPDVAVITTFGEMPVHVEFFNDPDGLKKEKSKIIDGLDENGCAILNGDDKLVYNLKSKTKAKTIIYGFDDNQFDLSASNYNISPDGINFKLDYKSNIIPVRMNNALGRQFVYTALGAIAVGLSQNINLVEAVESLSKFKPPLGRMNLIDGVKNSFIIDDTYNSSPIAVSAALNVLKELPAERKIAVLGDMLELGKFTIDEHKKIGGLIKEKGADLLFTVGPRAKFIADEAITTGFRGSNVFSFSTPDEAKILLQEKIKEGDLILVKGSQSMRMEKIIEEIMAHPEQKNELLVRQDKEWLNR
ncbi:MAG: UDP-N-acetylmuramoyl-tripeptide-D-alanyl-D-alanine ligase [Parcubacteria group bacterium Athens0714_24]|nr:MAG: UDP-N-acetylmuramoyl-tripeptide-D-alanyl-D-alanine ligase [Parcubacteria group bacterium Athens0714_24]